MTDLEYKDMWQSDNKPIALGPVKTHIQDELAMRKRFRHMIYGVHGLTIVIALGFDLQGLTNWPGIFTAISLICLFVQIYKIEKTRSNRVIPYTLTPRESLIAALQQNKINLRNAWLFSDVIPISGIIGGLVGGLLSRYIISIDAVTNPDKSALLVPLVIIIGIICCAGVLASHIIGRRIFKIKKSERAVLRKRLTLLDAGIV